MKAKSLREILIFEEEDCLITENNDQRNDNQFKDLTRDELIKKVKELETERTVRTEFFTNIVEELEKEKKSLISEKNGLKQAATKRKSNVHEEKNKANKPVESEEISRRSNITRSFSNLPSLPKRSKPDFRGLISQIQKRNHRPVGAWGADQLTLSQPEGADYAHQTTTDTLGFSDLPTAMNQTVAVKRCFKSESTPRQYKRTRIENDQRLDFEIKDEIQDQETSLETINSPDRFNLNQEKFELKERESDEVLETINSPEHSYAPSHVSSENSLDNSIEKSLEISEAFDLKQEKFDLEEGEIESDEVKLVSKEL